MKTVLDICIDLKRAEDIVFESRWGILDKPYMNKTAKDNITRRILQIRNQLNELENNMKEA